MPCNLVLYFNSENTALFSKFYAFLWCAQLHCSNLHPESQIMMLFKLFNKLPVLTIKSDILYQSGWQAGAPPPEGAGLMGPVSSWYV